MKNSSRLSLTSSLLLILASGLGYLPIRWTSAFGAVIGGLVTRHAIWINTPAVTRFYKSIEKITGITSAEIHKKCLIEYGRQTGRVYAEFTLIQKIDQQGHITIEGEENLGDLCTPVIFIVPHLANWELVAKVLCLMTNPTCYLFKPIESEAQMRIVHKARSSWGRDPSFVSTDSPQPMRQLIKKLFAGENLVILPDEIKHGYIWGPLLGREIPYCGNRWMVARLAVKYNIDIVPLCVERINKIDFKITIAKRIPVPCGGNKDSKAKYLSDQIDHKIDGWVRKRPEHWFLVRYMDFDKEMPGRF